MSEIKIHDRIKVTAGTYYNETGKVYWIESGLPQLGTRYKVILDNDGKEVELGEDNIEKFSSSDDGDYITEMAKINPPLHKRIMDRIGFIYVSVPQGDEGPIPHMHIYHDRSLDNKKCSFIRLDKAEYSPHHPMVPLPDKLRSSFMEIMRSIWPNYSVEVNGKMEVATGYEAAVDTWIETHGLADSIEFNRDRVTGRWIMPPYEELFKR
jgi:hypothetical protein